MFKRTPGWWKLRKSSRPPAEGSGNASAGNLGRTRRWRRRLLVLLAVLLAVILVLRLALWLSLPWILNRTLADYGLEAGYEGLSLSLLTGDMELWHLTVTAEEERLAHLEYCRAEVSLHTLLTQRLVIPRLEIDGMDVSLRRAADGTIPALRQVIAALQRPPEATVAEDTQPAKSDSVWPPADLRPPCRLDALRLQHVQVHMQDASVSPPLDSLLDVTLRLSDLGSDRRPTRFQLAVSSRPVLDYLMVEGTGTGAADRLSADIRCIVQGVHPQRVAGYLSRLGIDPTAEELSLAGQGRIDLTLVEPNAPVPDAGSLPREASGDPNHPTALLRMSMSMTDCAVTVDGRRDLSLANLALSADIPEKNHIRVADVELSDAQAHLWRDDQGRLAVAGISRIPRPAAPSKRLAPNPAVQSASDRTPAWSWSLESLQLHSWHLHVHDQAIQPATDTELQLDELVARNIGNVPSADRSPATFRAHLQVPGAIDAIELEGTADVASARKAAGLSLSAQGIDLGLFDPYLEQLGLESLYRDGRFQCQIQIRQANADPGQPASWDMSLRNLRLEDERELFALGQLDLTGAAVGSDPPCLSVQRVEVSGQRFAVQRDRNGNLNTLGLRIGAGRTPEEEVASAADVPQERQGSGTATGPDTGPTGSSPGPEPAPARRIEIRHLSWQDSHVTFTDALPSPEQPTTFVGQFGAELQDILLAPGQTDPNGQPGQVRFWLRVPQVLEEATLTGSLQAEGTGLSFALALEATGLEGGRIRPYVQPLGIDPIFASGSLRAQLQGGVRPTPQGMQGEFALKEVALSEGDQEQVTVQTAQIDGMEIAPGKFALARLAVREPHLRMGRDPNGNLVVGGVRLIPNAPGTGSETEEAPAATRTEVQKRPGILQVRELTVDQGAIGWHDEALQPAVDATGHFRISVKEFTTATAAPPAQLYCAWRLPGVLEAATIEGRLFTGPARRGLDLSLAMRGLEAGPLAAYLPEHIQLALTDGRMRTHLRGFFEQDPNGCQSARLTIEDFDYRDGTAAAPLLQFDQFQTIVRGLEPQAPAISVEEVSLAGLEGTMERTAPQTLQVLGLAIQSPPERAEPRVSSGADTGDPNQARPARTAASASPLPTVRLRRLNLGVRQLTFHDRTHASSEPLTLADLHLANEEPLELNGVNPQESPPLRLQLRGRLQPLVGALQLDSELSLFGPEVSARLQWELQGIHGPGLAAVFPQVGAKVDGNDLAQGRFTGSAEARLTLRQRNTLGVDLGKPFGASLQVNNLRVVNQATDQVLAGLEQLEVEASTVDLARRRVQVKRVEVVRPQGSMVREAEGIRVLDLVIRDPNRAATVPAEAAAAVPPTPSPGASPATDAPFDLQIDQVLVNGLDISFTDKTADPPVAIPLNGLDAEVRGLGSSAWAGRRPVQFNVILNAGEVVLPGMASADPNRGGRPGGECVLFQEAIAAGRLILGSKPRGWVRAGLSGLELTNFRGWAQQKGVTLKDGVLDTSVDVRFVEEGVAKTRVRLAFTDLSLTEPADGPLQRRLQLPAPLDAVLFVLRGPGGTIRLPFQFKVDRQGLSRGQIVQAAFGASGAVIANAVAGSPLRAMDAVGGLLGIGGRQQESEQEELVLEIPAGQVEIEPTVRAELNRLIERMLQDRGLALTVRHELGTADVHQVERLANPTLSDSLTLLNQLRQRRDEILALRNMHVEKAGVLYTAGSSSQAREQARQLRLLDGRLYQVEQALDAVLEMMRPATEYTTARRTREAALTLARARLGAVHDAMLHRNVPDLDQRAKFAPPRFSEPRTDQGAVVFSLVRGRAR